MLDFKVILEINKGAIKSMKCDSDDEMVTSRWKKIVFIFSFYLLPLLTLSIAWNRNVKLTSIETYIGTVIAIFIGLFFSLLLSIGAKVKSEKDNPNKDESNFQRFKTSMKQIANIVLYVIVIGIFIFITMLANTIFKSNTCVYVEKVFTAIAIFFLVQFIVSLFYIIQRFYYLVRDEINNII